ncbi:MAG: nuclear transport factor 2 family protein [Acidimicrobiales bacterium]|nr:nuclear transport factor 2 family protein [Acidimicrobiales bacterium]
MENETVHRTTSEVAENHISAVLRGDPKQMAYDYAAHAVLERGGTIYKGITEIQEYFNTVPERLGSAEIFFDKLIIENEKATFFWRMVGDTLIAAGKDILTIENGKITHQVVHLDSQDF